MHRSRNTYEATNIMNFKRGTSKQADEPEYYYAMRKKGILKESEIPDTLWFVESEASSKKTYLLQIHMKKLVYNGGRNANNAYGRIECDCASFVYCKTTPRHCKHSVELARRFFGDRAMQYRVLGGESYRGTIQTPDEWCEENYKIFEALIGKPTKKTKYVSHTTAGIRYLERNPELHEPRNK